MIILPHKNSQSRARLRGGTRLVGLIAVGCLLAVVAYEPAYAAGYRLSLSTAGLARWVCEDSISGSFADMQSELIVRIMPVGREVAPSDYAGVLAWEWPANLHVEISRSVPGDTAFVPDPDLKDQLDLHYYIYPDQAYYDSVWRQTGQTPPWYDLAPVFRFPFRLPESLIGQQICFRVSYESERYGTLISEETKCLTVKRPISAWDTALVRDDMIRHADGLQDWRAVLHLTDSLISLGWTSLYSLGMASGAARQLGQYDKAIYYLDLCFERHGSIFIKEEGGAIDTAAERRLYEDQRARLQELSRQQQR